MRILYIVMAHSIDNLESEAQSSYKDKTFYKNIEFLNTNYYKKMNAEYILVKCNENLKEEYIINNDTLWVKSKENMTFGVSKKVITALTVFGKHYDFIFKTTICCVPNINLIKLLCQNNAPNPSGNTDYFFAGPRFVNDLENKEFIGGFGMLLSKKTIPIILDNWEYTNKSDDEKITQILTSKSILPTYLSSSSIHNETMLINKLSLLDISTILKLVDLSIRPIVKICIHKETNDSILHYKIQEMVQKYYLYNYKIAMVEL